MSKHGSQNRSDVPRKFFDKSEQARIVAAVSSAELQTSGEIRFHVERDVPTGPPAKGDAYARARQVFAELGMHATEARNGVLVYMAVRERKFAVVGDEALHEKVGDGFWDETIDVMKAHFREDDFAGGVCAGIERIGEQMREHFPYQADDVNELSDEISFE